jgi:redox-sensing transcriptional repressor
MLLSFQINRLRGRASRDEARRREDVHIVTDNRRVGKFSTSRRLTLHRGLIYPRLAERAETFVRGNSMELSQPGMRPAIRPELIPDPAVRRLSLYLRQLEAFKRKDRRTISSRQLGESLRLTDAQVRKDLAYFGQFGHPGIGYRVDDLIGQVRHILGTDKTWNVILIGAGNLGRALIAYRGFEAKGFKLTAVLDNDPAKFGKKYGSFTIGPLESLEETIRTLMVRLAILTVPADVAQDVADRLIEAGVRGILNFAPVSLAVPETVALNSVDLAVQLEQLSFQVNVGRSL